MNANENRDGAVVLNSEGESFYCISIIGLIEGHYVSESNQKSTKYDHILPLLVSIEENENIDGLLILINTLGGDVEAGLAISELIASMSKPTASIVLGGGHSIGVPLAVSADRSFIVPSATMTVHPVRTNGLVLGVPQTLNYFQNMQERIVRFVCDNSEISPDRFRELMHATGGELVTDVGTVLGGETAVKEGLIDHVGTLGDAMECLYEMIKDKQ